jgi:hypothetical protein
MFVCVCPAAEEAPLQKLSRKLSRASALELERVTVPGGAPFFRMDVHAKAERMPWNEIEHCAGRLRTKLLLPPGLALPAEAQGDAAHKEAGMRVFSARRLPMLLALRTATCVLRLCKTPAQQLRVTLADSKSLCAAAVEQFVPLAASLRVFCNDFGAYRQTAAGLLSRYGVTLLLSRAPAVFMNSDVTIVDDLALLSGAERGLVLWCGEQEPSPETAKRLENVTLVRCDRPVLPEAIAPLCPTQIDPLVFAGALYELSIVKEMERLPLGRMRLGAETQECTLGELAARVDTRVQRVLAGIN